MRGASRGVLLTLTSPVVPGAFSARAPDHHQAAPAHLLRVRIDLVQILPTHGLEGRIAGGMIVATVTAHVSFTLQSGSVHVRRARAPGGSICPAPRSSR